MMAQVNNRIYDELAQTWRDENELTHLLREESCTGNPECPDMEDRRAFHFQRPCSA
jgi:hypothetical protein